MKADKKARFQGYTFFFKEGFCWTNVLNPNARLLKAKIKQKSINDVGSMSLYSISKQAPNYYLVSILNSNLLFTYYREFINCTVNIQINDIRQIPVVIPTAETLSQIKALFDQLVEIKKNEFCYYTKEENKILEIENQIESIIAEIYGIQLLNC